MKSVAPPAGAWIETEEFMPIECAIFVAPPAGAWIETRLNGEFAASITVAPPAGAWIETIQIFDSFEQL